MTVLPPLAEIAAEIRAKRARLQLSQTELAQRAGLTQIMVSRAEQSKHKDYELKRHVLHILDVVQGEKQTETAV